MEKSAGDARPCAGKLRIGVGQTVTEESLREVSQNLLP